MQKLMTRACALVLLAIVVEVASSTLWSAADEHVKSISDEWCGFSIAAPEAWQRAPLSRYTVPGVIRCAWSGPNHASITVFLQEAGKAFSPRFLVDVSASAMKDKLGAEVSVSEVREIAGMKAMWLVAAGKGTGGTLDGKGEIETTTHWVAVPRERDIIVLLLTCRTADYKDLDKTFGAVVGRLKLTGAQTPAQKASM